MTTSYNGFYENILTFRAATDFTSSGVMVTMDGSNTVNACDEGDLFCGVSKGVRNGYVAVQISGAVTVPYSGTAPTPGYVNLESDDNGGVQVSASGGRQCLVFCVDTTGSLVTFLL